MKSDDLTLTIGGTTISGWMNVRVTRGIERCPNDFDLSITERYPVGDVQNVTVRPGDECQLKIDGDLVITGYVDKYVPSIDARSHTIRIIGRGKCQDLVDCAAEWPNGQISGANVLQIATKLAKPYGISVSESNINDEKSNVPIPQLNLILTETAWEIIERTCRFLGMLAYELPDGNLFISRVGTRSMMSGLYQGENIQRATYESSMDQRFSEYHVYRQSVNKFNDEGTASNEIAIFNDENVRHRRMSIISEGVNLGYDIGKTRALWERNRRIGRSHKLMITADSWRDSAGNLWEPNTKVDVSLPSLKLYPDPANWLISEVTYNRGEYGTTADLIIMPPDAFLPMPILLYPTFAEFAYYNNYATGN